MDFEASAPRLESKSGVPVFTTFFISKSNSPLPDTVREILAAYSFITGYQDIDRDASLVSAEIVTHLPGQVSQTDLERIEVLRPVFYRDNYALLIGRIILHPDQGNSLSSSRSRWLAPQAVNAWTPCC